MEIKIELKKKSKDSVTIRNMTERAVRFATEERLAGEMCPKCGGSNLIAHIDEITNTEASGIIHCDDCSNDVKLHISHKAGDEISKVVNNFNESLLKSFKKL